MSIRSKQKRRTNSIFLLPQKVSEQDDRRRCGRRIFVQWQHQEAVDGFFRNKEGMLGSSIPKDRIHIVIVNASFGGRRQTFGSLSFGQGAFVDLVLVEISEERFDSCSNTSPTLGNIPASVADPNVPVTFVSLLVGEGIHLIFDPFGKGMEYPDNYVFRSLKGFRVPTDNVKKEFAARAVVLDQTVECLVASDTVPAEIAPLVAFEWILTT
mmetsp:Transcript_19760/g.49161  ORF Transcript_19760/g.49161 Transcript_19760/m.49161 type:complete len:211 (-) Transcript_19760:771-1403(-)